MTIDHKDLHYLTIHESHRLIRSRALSPVELTRAYLDRIEAVDGQLHAYYVLKAEAALAEARLAEAEILQGHYRGPLHGIPVAVKDQFDLQGIPAAIRNRNTEEREKTVDATVVAKLKDAGAVVLGKLMMSGLPDVPQSRNPWNLDHGTGGSSTGPGAAVVAGLCMAAMGEDTAGSIRNPASLSGLVGLKPTYGRVSRYGLANLSWSLDHSGPMTWVVEDIAHMLQAIAGYDSKDPTSIRVPVPYYSASLREGLKGVVIGIPRDYIKECEDQSDPEILVLVENAFKALQHLGAHLEEVSIPSLSYATLANAVIYSNENFASHKSNLHAVMKSAVASRRARLYLGALSGAADYIQAQRIRSRLKRELAKTFRQVDLLALPGQPQPAPLIEGADPLATLYRNMAPDFVGPFNLSGLPAMCVPCGFNSNHLPTALQLVGKPFDEPTVIKAAYTYQQHAKHYEQRPSI